MTIVQHGNFLFYIILNTCMIISTEMQDCSTISYEKTSKVKLHKSFHMKVILSGKPHTVLDCLQRCSELQTCDFVEWEYRNLECRAYAKISKDEEAILIENDNLSNFFEKICATAPNCSKLWFLERIVGFELDGYDDVFYPNVPTRISCAQLCLADDKLPCRSVEYNERSKECRLSSENRNSRPQSFRPTSSDIHYIESQCRREESLCEFEEVKNQRLHLPDSYLYTTTKIECQKTCNEHKSFNCRSFMWNEFSNECLLSSNDMESGETNLSENSRGIKFYQRTLCLSLNLECSGNAMEVNLLTNEPFDGVMFTQQSPSCQKKGTSTKITTFSIKFDNSSCGVVKESNGVFSTVLVIQHHPVIQRKGDRALKILCVFNTTKHSLASGFSLAVDNGRGVTSSIINATVPSPKIKFRIVDKHDRDITGAKIGDELFINLQVEDSNTYGITARNLIAKNRDDSDSVVLLDENGCPIDPGIFPSLHFVPDSKGLMGKFEAFRFSGDAVVRFQLEVQLCMTECPSVQCGQKKSYSRQKRNVNEQNSDKIYVGRLNSGRNFLQQELPLHKEIIVENAHVERVEHPTVKSKGNNNKKNYVCTPKDVVIVLVITAVALQVFVVSVVVLCITVNKGKRSRKRSQYALRQANARSVANSSNQTLRNLRISYRD